MRSALFATHFTADPCFSTYDEGICGSQARPPVKLKASWPVRRTWQCRQHTAIFIALEFKAHTADSVIVKTRK